MGCVWGQCGVKNPGAVRVSAVFVGIVGWSVLTREKMAEFDIENGHRGCGFDMLHVPGGGNYPTIPTFS